jgi:SAM-dependent methyltransferase
MGAIPFTIGPRDDQQGYNIWKDDPRDSVLSMDLLRYHFINKIVGTRALDVLDLGCGDGYLSFLLSKIGHRVTAVDVNSARMERFAEIAKENNIRQITASFADLKFPSQSFDCVICLEVLEHLDDPQDTLKIARQVLRPMGTAIVAVPVREDLRLGQVNCPKCGCSFHRDGHVQSFSINSLRALFQESGLDVKKIWPFQSVFTRQLQMALNALPGELLLIADRLFNRLFPRLARRIVIKAVLTTGGHD